MRRLLMLLLFLLAPCAGFAHVGSKDVFETVKAGPYTFFVTIRPPNVVPGVATVEIRSTGAEVTGMRITPLPVTGEASKHAPAADVMERNRADQAFFTGTVWMMAGGTWQVRIAAEGVAGPALASVPVVAVPVTVLKMRRPLGFGLALLGLFLVISLAGVIAASVREARLAPGTVPDAKLRRRGGIALAGSLGVLALVVWLGGKWWNVEAADYAEHVYRPSPTTATLTGNVLNLVVHPVPTKDLLHPNPKTVYLADHGKLMHLYAIREPEMDAAFHLHPQLVGETEFRDVLPSLPAGRYKLFGDVVHSNGFPETLLAEVDIPDGMAGAPLAAEDAEALPAPLSWGMLEESYRLPDGYRMVWARPAKLTASTGYSFRFTLLDPQGRPATGMEPYLGMAGHAAFVKTDGSVFAHTHPDGSAAMPDVMLAEESMGAVPVMEAVKVEPVVSFPYGFPTSGRYRIFIQMKHSGVVETGVFDADVK